MPVACEGSSLHRECSSEKAQKSAKCVEHGEWSGVIRGLRAMLPSLPLPELTACGFIALAGLSPQQGSLSRPTRSLGEMGEGAEETVAGAGGVNDLGAAQRGRHLDVERLRRVGRHEHAPARS